MTDIRENKHELNNLMQRIGNTILSILETNWIKAAIGYFIETSGVTHLQFYVLYYGEDDYTDIVKLSWDISRYDDAIIEIEDICKELHDLCESANDKWTSISYVLENNGSYNADYGYDSIDNYDSGFILNWQSKYLD